MNARDGGTHVLVRNADERSSSHSHKLSETERQVMVGKLNAEARAIRRLDYERDRELAERAFDLASERNAEGQQYTFGMAQALSLLAHRNCILGELDLALSQAGQALALLGQPTPSVVVADLYDCIGWCHFCLGDYAEALDFLMKALQIAERIGDRSIQAYVLDNIGSVHTSSDHADVGLESQERSLSLHRELRDPMGEALTQNNISYTYMALGRDDDALAAATSALHYAESEGRHYLEMWVLDTLSDVYLHMRNADAAEVYAERALLRARKYHSEADEANGLMALGEVSFLRKDWDASLEQVEKALTLIERLRLSVERYECYKMLSEIQQHRGDFETSLAHYKRYHQLKQAKVNEETACRLANLRVTHQVETARRDAEIHRLRSLALEQEVEERRVAQTRLEAQASLDPLTGLYNRGHLAVLADDLRLHDESHRPVSLMMFDADRFKDVNDTYGHLAGDSVLVSVARQLSDNARETDVPCRYGGDEFLMLLVGMTSESAENVAERFRQRIAASRVPYGDSNIQLTISVGVATVEADEPAILEDLIRRADAALYEAKKSGGNRVVVDRPRADGASNSRSGVATNAPPAG